MKMIQGHTFKVSKSRMDFKLGETYRIYHIAKLNEGTETAFKYTFFSSSGSLEVKFDSTEQAEAVITKISAGK